MLLKTSTLLALGVAVTSVVAWNDGSKKTSVIFLIPDGMGPSHATLAREVAKVEYDIDERFTRLAFDEHVLGTVQTRSLNNLVTDSAAAGTAFACGLSTNNGYIAVNNDSSPIATVLEGAKAKGYWTGLISTARITHATPAAFSSHVLDRDSENLIASQQLGGYALGRQVDLLWGGGRRHFLPQSDDSSTREDDRDLIAEAEQAGYAVVRSRQEFDSYAKDVKAVKRNRFAGRSNVHLPSLGLFTNSHMSYEIDRLDEEEPSLAELAVAGLDALNGHDAPFFIMVESGRIDHAAHANDPSTLYHEVMAFEETYKKVIEWVDAHKDDKNEYVVITIPDHDTGGVVLPGNWKPSYLLNSTASVEYLDGWVEDNINANQTVEETKKWVLQEVILGKLGMTDIDDELLDTITADARNASSSGIAGHLSDAINTASGLTWGTGGHSQVDVDLYFYPYRPEDKSAELVGNHANIEAGQWIGDFIGIDRAAINVQLAGIDIGPSATSAAE